MTSLESPSKSLADKLHAALEAFALGPVLGGHSRPIILGVTSKGAFVGHMTADQFFARACQIVVESNRGFRYGNSICLETGGTEGPRLMTLAIDRRAEPGAASLLANLFVVGVGGGEQGIQSLTPPGLVAALLASDPLWEALPAIDYYSRRPVFDRSYSFRQPGWHPTCGILVHGLAVEMGEHQLASNPEARALDRLPPRLRGLLREFSWRSDADLVNAVGFLLTGLLINHFIDVPHPMAIVDANQPGVGETLLVQVIGRALDGVEPPGIPLNRDEELEKRLGSEVRSRSSSIILLDNVRKYIESAILEQNVLSPQLSFRDLGSSSVIRCPNSYLWAVTKNGATGSPDIVRRGLPIRLEHNGDPKERRFDGNPLDYAGDHRLEILGELAGMVMYWLQAGKPPGSQRHRCERWAATIGGILDACGLGEFFLANWDEAESEMDQGLQDLIALAEHAAAAGNGLAIRPGQALDQAGKAAKDWLPAFSATQVLRDQLITGSDRSKSTLIGSFLAARVERSVPIETAAGPGTATLRCHAVRSGRKAYYFEIVEGSDVGGAPATAPGASPVGATGPAPVPAEEPSSGPAPLDANIAEAAGEESPIWF
jgi:hypothetical protein